MNMSNIVNVYRKQTTNVGDMFSTPTMYFDFLKDAEKYDIYMDYPAKSIDCPEEKALILGGGGLISNEDFSKAFEWLTNLQFRNKIIWGAGHNTHGSNEKDFVDPLLADYDLVGIRDFGTNYDWVPCASCMSEAFDRDYQVSNKIVVYEHKDQPLNIGEFPKMNNKQDDIFKAVKFLASAEYVVTNTYHGIFWATLLNRKVILINPFSSKFMRMKHSPLISTIDSYKNDLDKAISYPGSLVECRKANTSFSEKIKQLTL